MEVLWRLVSPSGEVSECQLRRRIGQEVELHFVQPQCEPDPAGRFADAFQARAVGAVFAAVLREEGWTDGPAALAL